MACSVHSTRTPKPMPDLGTLEAVIDEALGLEIVYPSASGGRHEIDMLDTVIDGFCAMARATEVEPGASPIPCDASFFKLQEVAHSHVLMFECELTLFQVLNLGGKKKPQILAWNVGFVIEVERG